MSAPTARRVVVITGANEGIGYHTLRTLLEDGYRVAALDVETNRLQSLRERSPERLLVFACDVTEDDDVERAIERIIDEWDRIDILVNNAAILEFGFVEDRTLTDTKRVFEVNFFGYVRTVRAVLPHMRDRNEGIIHNVSSGVGRVGSPGLSGYAATKGAVESFTRSLRHELRRENVTCTILHPRLAHTRSAMALGYPASWTSDPEYVGRRLARRIESTRPVVYADPVTRLGLALAQRVPALVRRGTERFLDERDATTNVEG